MWTRTWSAIFIKKHSCLLWFWKSRNNHRKRFSCVTPLSSYPVPPGSLSYRLPGGFCLFMTVPPDVVYFSTSGGIFPYLLFVLWALCRAEHANRLKSERKTCQHRESNPYWHSVHDSKFLKPSSAWQCVWFQPFYGSYLRWVKPEVLSL